jgi:hypothetical protein
MKLHSTLRDSPSKLQGPFFRSFYQHKQAYTYANREIHNAGLFFGGVIYVALVLAKWLSFWSLVSKLLILRHDKNKIGILLIRAA